MNETDTADIVKRIVTTFPLAPKGFIWTERLAELDDYRLAFAAFAQLRDEVDEQRISVARFMLTYRTIEHRGNTSRRHDLEGTRHERCDGTGMITVWERHGEHEYSATTACDCPLGVAAQATLRRVIAANDVELDRCFPRRDRTYERLTSAPEAPQQLTLASS